MESLRFHLILWLWKSTYNYGTRILTTTKWYFATLKFVKSYLVFWQDFFLTLTYLVICDISRTYTFLKQMKSKKSEKNSGKERRWNKVSLPNFFKKKDLHILRKIKICDGKKMSKNMYWSTYVDFKTGKKVDIEADIVYCYNYQQSKEVLEDSEEL